MQKTVSYHDASPRDRQSMADAAPVPAKARRSHLLRLKIHVAEATAKLRAAQEKCTHPIADRTIRHYADRDTLGKVCGGGYVVGCALCDKTIARVTQ